MSDSPRLPGRYELDARATYDKLVSLSDRSNPTRTAYLSQIAGKTCIVYDLQGRPVTVRAENIETYIGKGFTFDAPAPSLDKLIGDAILPAGDGGDGSKPENAGDGGDGSKPENAGDGGDGQTTEEGVKVKNDEETDPPAEPEPEPHKSSRKVK